MKPLDLKSMLVAIAIGALVAWTYHRFDPDATSTTGIMEGAIVGASVQIAVRLTGVS